MSFPTKEYPSTYSLPPSLAKELGHIIVRFAFLEHNLSHIIYVLLRVDHKQGRVAIRDPGAVDRLEIITDLCLVMKFTPKTDIKLLRRVIEEVQGKRNMLAHGVWIKDGNRILLRDSGSRGATWKPDGKNSVKKKINPRAIRFVLDEARKIRILTEDAIKMARELGFEIDEVLYPPE